MATTSKAAIFSLAALALIWAPSNLSAQSDIKDRVAAAIKSLKDACGDDIKKFCGNVTQGEGRVLLCMQAYDDQLSRTCQFSLYRASRNLDRAVNRVERLADACMTDIEAQCGNADHIGQCVMEKSGSLSPSCQTVVTALKQMGEALETRGGR
jgi:hypothetical protein